MQSKCNQNALKKLLVFSLMGMFFPGASFAQIQMNSSGNVAIGTTPNSYKLRVNGMATFKSALNSTVRIDNSGYSGSAGFWGGANIGKPNYSWYVVYAANYPSVSDERQKENIRPLTSSLDKLTKLNAIKYDYKRESAALNAFRGDGKNTAALDAARKGRVGFSAQEVEKFIPEVVWYDDSTDIYAIDYTKLTPYLVDALKEQQDMIADQEQRITNLEEELQKVKNVLAGNPTKNASLQGDMAQSETATPELFQNNPNPFTESTEIEYYLPEGVSTASLYIYDMNGKQLKNMPLNQIGQGTVSIQGGELDAGMYLYTLVADGQALDTKQMILTD